MIKPAKCVIGIDCEQGFAQRVQQSGLRSRLGLTQKRLDLGPTLFDRVQVGRIGRQIDRGKNPSVAEMPDMGPYVNP